MLAIAGLWDFLRFVVMVRWWNAVAHEGRRSKPRGSFLRSMTEEISNRGSL